MMNKNKVQFFLESTVSSGTRYAFFIRKNSDYIKTKISMNQIKMLFDMLNVYLKPHLINISKSERSYCGFLEEKDDIIYLRYKSDMNITILKPFLLKCFYGLFIYILNQTNKKNDFNYKNTELFEILKNKNIIRLTEFQLKIPSIQYKIPNPHNIDDMIIVQKDLSGKYFMDIKNKNDCRGFVLEMLLPQNEFKNSCKKFKIEINNNNDNNNFNNIFVYPIHKLAKYWKTYNELIILRLEILNMISYEMNKQESNKLEKNCQLDDILNKI